MKKILLTIAITALFAGALMAQVITPRTVGNPDIVQGVYYGNSKVRQLVFIITIMDNLTGTVDIEKEDGTVLGTDFIQANKTDAGFNFVTLSNVYHLIRYEDMALYTSDIYDAEFIKVSDDQRAGLQEIDRAKMEAKKDRIREWGKSVYGDDYVPDFDREEAAERERKAALQEKIKKDTQGKTVTKLESKGIN